MTRSVRRLPTSFVLEPLGEITTSPWDHGYACLGHRTLYSKHVSPPLPVGMPMTDVDAEHVKNYAATHAGSNSDHEDPLEAGDDIAPAAGNEPAEPMDASTIAFFSCRPSRPRPGHGHSHPATATRPRPRPPGHPVTRPRPPGDGHPATATATRSRPHGHTVTRPTTATRPHGHTATRPHGHTATRPHWPHGHTRPPGHPASPPAGHLFPAFLMESIVLSFLTFFEQLATRSCMVPGAMLFSFPGSFATRS